MDIKSTNNRMGRIIGIFVSLLILSIISAVMVAAYPYIVKRAEAENYTAETTHNIEGDFINSLNRGVYSILMEEYASGDEYENPSDILINPDIDLDNYRENENNYSSEYDYNDYDDSEDVYIEEGYDDQYYHGSYYNTQEFLNDVDNTLESWHSDFYDSTLMNFPLDYYFVNHDTEYVMSNSLTLKNLWKGDKKNSAIRDNYGFAAVFQIDENGNVKIPLLHGLKDYNKESIINTFNNLWDEYSDVNWQRNRELIQSPKNITVVFAAGDENFYDNYLTYNDGFSKFYAFENGGFFSLFIMGLFLATLFALLLPAVKFLGIGTLSAKIPMELTFFGAFFSLALYEQTCWTAADTAFGGAVFNGDLWIAGILKIPERILTLVVNYGLWMLILGAWYVVVLSIRPLFVKGPVRFIKENIFVIKFFIRIKQWLTGLIKEAAKVDLKSPLAKRCMLILGINYAISAVICLFWIGGVLIFIPYTIILYILITKQIKIIKGQYDVVLEATSRMADGNLEIEITEDAGMFESLKDELVQVQSGFKKAVVEETKSQQMKTELITNVSHDLKTPLTAIITYINLLKDESTTEEERASYIETIDQKSQRLKYLIEDLFEVSKASSNNVTLNPVEIDLVSLIKQVQLELDDKIKESGIEFRNIFPEEKIILNLDSEKTYRIFENLTTNIIKYAMKNTRAYVEILLLERGVQISFKNISDAELQVNPNDLTERFVRGDRSRNTEGSGLGLAIVKSFVELQGGRFDIQSDGDLFKAVIEWKK